MSADGQQKQPPQSQSHQPGRESKMIPKPEFQPRFRGADKLKGKVALITGGDSGIGRAVAVHMAREGADIAVVYLEEVDDAAGRRFLHDRTGAASEWRYDSQFLNESRFVSVAKDRSPT